MLWPYSVAKEITPKPKFTLKFKPNLFQIFALKDNAPIADQFRPFTYQIKPISSIKTKASLKIHKIKENAPKHLLTKKKAEANPETIQQSEILSKPETKST